MLETLICALITVFPDFLFRRFVQGKRIGKEITLFTMWYELRWGLTMCGILTLTVITTLFYFHPATTSVASYFRTVTVVPQISGRVTEIYVENNQAVEAGQPIFKLDDSSQMAQVEAANAQIAQVRASMSVAETDLAEANAAIAGSTASLTQAREDLTRNETLRDEGSSAVRLTEIERLENLVAQREAQVAAAEAQKSAVEQQIQELLPAQMASAEGAIARSPNRTGQNAGHCWRRWAYRTVRVGRRRLHQSNPAPGGHSGAIRFGTRTVRSRV